MAECGICLDALRNPVSIPCGHVHCERCLRAHISSGANALSSTCPTCRKLFHIATPDFAFVPQKYHDFILPPVRKIYMDIPSTTALTEEIDILTNRLQDITKENERLRERCHDYKYALEIATSEKRAALDREQQARQDAFEIRRKYESVKKKYWDTQSRDHASDSSTSQSGRRNTQNFEVSGDAITITKVEDSPVTLQAAIPHRPKRALPRSRLSHSMRCPSDGSVHPPSAFVKRPRLSRYSDIGSSSQELLAVFQDESEDDDDDDDDDDDRENQ